MPDTEDDIVFVVDARGLAANEKLIAALGARHIEVAALTPSSVCEAETLAIDVDLTNRSNVKLLRAALGARRTRLQVFAVDHQRRLETVYANIIGATDVLRRPFTGEALTERLRRHGHQQLLPSGDPGRASAASAASALSDMFGALVAAEHFDAASIASAGIEVIDAISDLGFPSWVDTVRRHHEGTFQHCLIVTGVVTAFAQGTGMGKRDVQTLTSAGLMHDIGKALIPVAILDKPGKLTAEEFSVIQRHPDLGYKYLAGNEAVSANVRRTVLHHHEYLDGSGYPDGLDGGDIDDLTRILTVCDVYGALIERRSYKPPMASDQAFGVLDAMAAAGKLELPLVRALQHTVMH